MTASILAVAARIPPFALSAETVDRAYGRPPGRGGRRFSGYDEDSLTLAVEAADRCLRGFDRATVRSLFVASTTWPRSPAARVAAALDLPESVEIATFGGSSTCGAAALRIAMTSPRLPVLVVAADRLTAPPGSDSETSLGDGAAALLVGVGDGLARPTAWASRADATDWNSPDARFLSTRTSKLAAAVRPEGCSREMVATRGALPTIGFCGAAHPLLALVEMIEGAKAGERVAWIAVGPETEGAAFEVAHPPSTRTFVLDGARRVEEYGRWLASRTFFDGPQPAVFASPAIESRDADFLLRLHGTRCPSCGAIDTIPAPACGRCGAAKGDRIPLSRTGTVFTFTHEHYVPTPWPPVSMAVVDLDGGGRILAQVADAAADEVKVGARVRLVLRRLHMGGGGPNYYWKAVLE